LGAKKRTLSFDFINSNYAMPILFLFLSCSISFLPPVTSPFELVDEESGIQLYERWHETAEGRAYRELKSVLLVQANTQTLLRTLREEQRAEKWMRRVDEVQALPGHSRHHWYAYVRYDLPWPASDHDCTISYRQTVDASGTTTVRFESVALESHPVKEGIERITGLSGRWEFRKQGNGTTEVRYFIQTTKAPSLPRFVTDPIVRSNAMKTMAGYRKVAEQI